AQLLYNLNKMCEEIIWEIKQKALDDRVPIMEDEGMDYLCRFLQENNVQTLLEVGTAVGYSSMMMVHSNPELRILTLEQDEERYTEAVYNIKRCHMEDRINAVCTNAREYDTDEMFDVIFLDGPKAHNQQLFERFEKNLNPGGYFIIDDVWFHGFIDNPELMRSKRLKKLVSKLKRFTDNMMNNSNYECTYLKIGDGVLIARRRDTDE
ncbi:MAG: class I SAM-dependent methyltransferase, partial [Erysipelotrichaceae bacterium]|nr:class I SAM-dependent methyltransferase [Erysipelotrichaceae bacterium]